VEIWRLDTGCSYYSTCYLAFILDISSWMWKTPVVILGNKIKTRLLKAMEGYFVWTLPLPSINTDVVYGFLKSPPSRNLPRCKSQARRPTAFSANTKLCQQWKSSPPVHSGAEFVEWNENFVLHMQMEAASPKQRQKDILLLQETSQKMHKTEDPNNVWVNKLPTVNEFLSTTGDTIF